MNDGVSLMVGTEVSPEQGHCLAFGVKRGIPHAGRSGARERRDSGGAGIGSTAHPLSVGGRMLVPALAGRIVLAHAAPWEPLPDEGLPRFPERLPAHERPWAMTHENE